MEWWDHPEPLLTLQNEFDCKTLKFWSYSVAIQIIVWHFPPTDIIRNISELDGLFFYCFMLFVVKMM